jgi:hypothetical protein
MARDDERSRRAPASELSQTRLALVIEKFSPREIVPAKLTLMQAGEMRRELEKAHP